MTKKLNKPYCIETAIESDNWITIDCDNAIPVSIVVIGLGQKEDLPVYRPITKEERREIVYDTLAYGRTPLAYRLFRLLRMSMTKHLYPQLGAFSKFGSNSGNGSDRNREVKSKGHKDIITKYGPTLIETAIETDNWLTMDCDKALPVEIWSLGQAKGDERQIYRSITERERREIVLHTLAYGRTSLLYRLFRVLMLSMTKRLYPKHGAPNKSSLNSGTETEPSDKALNDT